MDNEQDWTGTATAEELADSQAQMDALRQALSLPRPGAANVPAVGPGTN
jgi:hypothetical protein